MRRPPPLPGLADGPRNARTRPPLQVAPPPPPEPREPGPPACDRCGEELPAGHRTATCRRCQRRLDDRARYEVERPGCSTLAIRQAEGFCARCRRAGINPATVRARMHDHGLTEEQALSRPVMGRRECGRMARAAQVRVLAVAVGEAAERSGRVQEEVRGGADADAARHLRVPSAEAP